MTPNPRRPGRLYGYLAPTSTEEPEHPNRRHIVAATSTVLGFMATGKSAEAAFRATIERFTTAVDNSGMLHMVKCEECQDGVMQNVAETQTVSVLER